MHLSSEFYSAHPDIFALQATAVVVVPATVLTNPTLQAIIDSAVSEVELHNHTLAPEHAMHVPSDFNLNPSKHFVHLPSAPSSHPAITRQALVVAFKNAPFTHFEHSVVFSALHSEQSGPHALQVFDVVFANPDLHVVHVAASLHTEQPSEQALQVLAVASKKKAAIQLVHVLSSVHILQFAIFPIQLSQIPIAVLFTFCRG